MKMLKNIAFFAVVALCFGCSDKGKNPLFELMKEEDTGISFNNKIENTEEFNIFNYRNFYNGGGVAVGDINNDGLPDVFFYFKHGK